MMELSRIVGIVKHTLSLTYYLLPFTLLTRLVHVD